LILVVSVVTICLLRVCFSFFMLCPEAAGEASISFCVFPGTDAISHVPGCVTPTNGDTRAGITAKAAGVF
jgi:hypothetical protein